MRARFHRRRWMGAAVGVVVAAAVAVPAIAASFGDTKSEHWGVITRNTIGSPVGDLRSGPYGSFGVTGPEGEPPFGKGSLGIEVADRSTSLNPASEKVAFGNEVDFFGSPVLGINEIGFHVFQTGENVGYGGPRNLPNITLEIDANLTALPLDNYTSMVWAPGPIAATSINRWSDYIDATTDGNWYFTGAEAAATLCTQALNCTFAQAMTALSDGGDAPVIYTLAVSKGRDNMWIGAVDALRFNDKIYDFEQDGVKDRSARQRGNNGENEDDDD